MFYICHIYLQHSSVFISLQLLYKKKTAQIEQFLPKHGMRLQRESGGLPERHLCVENVLNAHKHDKGSSPLLSTRRVIYVFSGCADFVPAWLEQDGVLTTGRTEQLSTIVNKAQSWLSRQHSFKLINVQSVDYKISSSWCEYHRVVRRTNDKI